jgi:hypothetical protein
MIIQNSKNHSVLYQNKNIPLGSIWRKKMLLFLNYILILYEVILNFFPPVTQTRWTNWKYRNIRQTINNSLVTLLFLFFIKSYLSFFEETEYKIIENDIHVHLHNTRLYWGNPLQRDNISHLLTNLLQYE